MFLEYIWWSKLGTDKVNELGFSVESSEVSKDGCFNGCTNFLMVWQIFTSDEAKYVKYEGLALVVYLRPTGVLVLAFKIGSIDGKMLDFTIHTEYEIKLGLNESIYLFLLIGPSEISTISMDHSILLVFWKCCAFDETKDGNRDLLVTRV